MVDTRDASTLTDVCTSEYLPEVELVSLVTESLPSYKLRADSATKFCLYENQDWGIQTPIIRAEDLQLSNLQIGEVLKYFILSGERLSQMTKVYDDIEAVTHLLEEKERDLELAARIGQSLLEQNKELACRCEQLEVELVQYQEQTEQLRYEIHQKEQLLQLLANETSDSQGYDCTDHSPLRENSNSKYIELVQKKLSSLEDENSLLRSELENLKEETEQLEEQEQRISRECVKQLNDSQKKVQTLQKDLDKKGVELIKCQEECASLLQQLVSGQQLTKELTIENLDMRESLKTSDQIQKELTGELFDLKEKYRLCKDLLDSTKNEVALLKQRASPRVSYNRYYTSPYILPPSDSLAAELETLADGERDAKRQSNLRVMETAQYVRKLSSRPSSLNSSMTSSSTPRTKPTKNPLLVAPIPGSNMAARQPIAPTGTPQLGACQSMTASTSSFYDEIERHRQNLGRPGIPGSKDLDKALRRLSLRRQNEASEREYHERERLKVEKSQSIVEDQPSMEWSQTSTPLARSPSPESELSGYASGSSFSYRMPEKLQIVKPLEGSATLHHWQRLATPDITGLFEAREGVQIKHEQPLDQVESTTFNLLDPEEDDISPAKLFQATQSTVTLTDARVLHPSVANYTRANSFITTTSVTSSSSRYGIVSRFAAEGLFDLGQSSSVAGIAGRWCMTSGGNEMVTAANATSHYGSNQQTKLNFSTGVVMSSYPRPSTITASSSLLSPWSGTPSTVSNSLTVPSYMTMEHSPNPEAQQHRIPNQTIFDQSNISRSIGKQLNQQLTMGGTTESVAPLKTPVETGGGDHKTFGLGLLSSVYNYLKPGNSTTTTNSGIHVLVSDGIYEGSHGSSAFGRWQKH